MNEVPVDGSRSANVTESVVPSARRHRDHPGAHGAVGPTAPRHVGHARSRGLAPGATPTRASPATASFSCLPMPDPLVRSGAEANDVDVAGTAQSGALHG